MTGDLANILTKSLERLAMLEGLSSTEIAARCILTGKIPTVPAFSAGVVSIYAKLETEQTRGGEAWQTEDALSGRR
jgi:hypothetical protein